MKMTLLQIVQSILSDMDGEEVNSLADTTEATQVASIVRDTYYNMVSNRTIPEHKELIKLTALSDNTRPTHFLYGGATAITNLWYATQKTGDMRYSELTWMDPVEFLRHTDGVGGNYMLVNDQKAGTKLRIKTDAMPTYYTSFDDEHVVMNSYDSSVDSSLQQSKVRAYGVVTPAFDMTKDNFTPDLDAHMFPYLLAESKSTAFSLLHGGSDPKVEQAARRQKSHLQNDKYNTTRKRKLSNYGR